MDVAVDPNDAWNALHPWQQRAALPILDMTRHMMDAFSKCANPLEMPGVVLMDRPENFCTRMHFKDYLTLLDTLFPNIQFFLATGTPSFKSIPASFWKKRLLLPDVQMPQKKCGPVRLPRDSVLLIDVDGRLPNLALMKLSAHYRSKGHKVWLGKRDCFMEGPCRVYASTLLYCPQSERRNYRLRLHYGEKLTLGGRERILPLAFPTRWRPCDQTTRFIRNWVIKPSVLSPGAAPFPAPSAWFPQKKANQGR